MSDFHLISGYLNPPKEFQEFLVDITAERMSFVGAAPEANSFFNAPFPKYLVPYFYQKMMLNLKKKMEQRQKIEGEEVAAEKVRFYEFFPEIDKPFKAKTFHAKGMFLKTTNKDFESFLGTIGSGNFSDRSYFRDNELNFWVYSKNPKLGQLLEEERTEITEACKIFDPTKSRSKGGLKGLIFNLLMKISKMG